MTTALAKPRHKSIAASPKRRRLGTARCSRRPASEGTQLARRVPDVPADHWALQKLSARAVLEYARIDQADKTVTPAYWYLGRALNAARKHFKRGTWERWLAEREIGEDCAWRARLIASAFERPGDVVGLSLRKALAIARGHKGEPSAEKLLRNFELRLNEAVKTATALAQKFDPDRRAALAGAIEKTRDALERIRCQCQP